MLVPKVYRQEEQNPGPGQHNSLEMFLVFIQIWINHIREDFLNAAGLV